MINAKIDKWKDLNKYWKTKQQKKQQKYKKQTIRSKKENRKIENDERQQ